MGHVLSASDDTTVCHWSVDIFLRTTSTAHHFPFNRDIQQYQKGSPNVSALRTYRGHTAVVEVGRTEVLNVNHWLTPGLQDVDWHASNDWMFASVADDRKLMV